jgi:hypothetical protein
MIIVDRLLIGGIRFVLDKIVAAVDRELNDDEVLRQRLLEAQMRAELGEITPEELSALEQEVMARLRAIQEARGAGPVAMDPRTMKITGVEATVDLDDDDPLRER